MTPNSQCDLAIIGGGPGGYIAAIRAAQAGLSTILIEETDVLGGVCLNRGCIPTKSLLRSAEAFDLAREGAEYGFTTTGVAPDFDRIMERCRTIPVPLANGIAHLMNKHGITIMTGHAALTSEKQIIVEGTSPAIITARDIILATGAHPASIPGIESDHVRVLTSDDILSLAECPASILIIGAGAIGVQYASFFNTFGTTVTLIDSAENILPGVDSDISKRLAFSFKKRGITIRTGITVDSVTVTDEGCHAILSDSSPVETSLVLVAAGYTGNIDGVGLESAGVITSRGFVTVDNSYRTNVPHIYAIGDVIGPPMLAHAASIEGERAVAAISGRSSGRLDPSQVPIAIYSRPQLASVGITSVEARERGIDVLTGTCPFSAVGKAVAMGETEGFVKVIIDRMTHLFLGAHVVGPDADETIQEVVLAMHTGLTADRLVNTIHPHPTLAEAVREATAAALGRPINT